MAKDVKGSREKQMVLGWNMHTMCLTVTEPEANDENTGDKDAYVAMQNPHRKDQTPFGLSLKFGTGALSKLQHFSINNLGDPFIGRHYGVHSRQFEGGVLDCLARLWEIEKNEYWGYITNCLTRLVMTHDQTEAVVTRRRTGKETQKLKYDAKEEDLVQSEKFSL